MNNLIKQVHSEFENFHDYALSEIERMTEQRKLLRPVKRSEFEKEIGFVDYVPKEIAEFDSDICHFNGALELSLYYQKEYPFYKFITQDRVDDLCNKYGLSVVEPRHFIGEIPAKNLEEMQRFSGILKDDDKVFLKPVKANAFHFLANELELFSAELNQVTAMISDFLQFKGLDAHSANAQAIFYLRGRVSREKSINIRGEQVEVGFKVCATPDLIDQDAIEAEAKLNSLKDDPIVLKPVRGGFLVITAWGPEASEVANEKMN